MTFNTLVLAAGAGTRMKSAVPKVAHELLGKPLIRWVVDTVAQAGCKQTVVVVGKGRELVAPLLPDCQLVVQEQLLGTGHAVQMARAQMASYPPQSSLLIVNGDTPLVRASTINALIELRETNDAACCVLGFTPPDPFGYGRLVRNAQGDLLQIVEQCDATPEQAALPQANSGVYCFRLSSLLDTLDQLSSDNAQGEFYLTQAVQILAGQGQRVCIQMANDANELLGINNRLQLAEAGAVARERINRQHMLAGVTMLDPATVWIGPDVQIAADVEILPMTIIYGKCQIDSGSVIGPNTRLNNSHIGENCVIDESIIIDSLIEDRVSCGPRSYLRPGTIMRSGSKAGTHVEIKNSEIGQNSKVPHLSYFGDARLGADVNIGAGSITCNFDGVRKNHTIIGDRSFIGSDTMFVAPVELGCDVTTGAGSVITKDVPSGVLAVARGKQIIVDDWAARRNASGESGESGATCDTGQAGQAR